MPTVRPYGLARSRGGYGEYARGGEVDEDEYENAYLASESNARTVDLGCFARACNYETAHRGIGALFDLMGLGDTTRTFDNPFGASSYGPEPPPGSTTDSHGNVTAPSSSGGGFWDTVTSFGSKLASAGIDRAAQEIRGGQPSGYKPPPSPKSGFGLSVPTPVLLGAAAVGGFLLIRMLRKKAA